MRRIGCAVTPFGQRAGGQFVQGHGGRVPLGVKVPARRLAQGEQRIEVSGRACMDGVDGCARKGKIIEHEVQFVAPPDMTDRDVVGLDVAMRDALFLKVVDHAQQVLAKTLQEINVEPALSADTLAERLDTFLLGADEHRTHQKRRAISDVHGIDEFHDVLMAEFLDDFGFIAKTLVVLRVTRHLEDALFSIAMNE